LSAPAILYPSELSIVHCGSQRSLLSLLSTRDRAFCRRIVLCPPGAEYVAALKDIGVEAATAGRVAGRWRFSPASLPGTVSDFVDAAGAAGGIVEQENVRLIHAASLVGALVALRARTRRKHVPIVLHERGLVYRRHTLPLFRWACRRVDRVIVTTDIGRQRLVSFGVSDRSIVTISNGTDFHLTTPRTSTNAVRSALGVGASTRLVGLVANMVRVKRHSLFIDTIAELVHRGEDVVGVIVGGALPILDGEAVEREVREHVEHRGMTERIIFAGQRSDVADVMRAMDLLLCTSSHESFGRVLIEAMAIGTPVVATRVGGIPDVVDHERTGLLADDTARALADAAQRLLSSDDFRSRVITCALESVRRHFDASSITARIEAIYREVLGE
jgi:glycosyltransferase involved in cell wall biosynthesis